MANDELKLFTPELLPDLVSYGRSFTLETEVNQVIQDMNAQSIRSPASYYKKIFNYSNPAMFQFMEKSQKQKLYQDLLLAYIYLAAQYNRDQILKKREQLAELQEKQDKCAYFLSKLNPQITTSATIVPDPPDRTSLAEWFTKNIYKISKGKTKFIKDMMGQLNERRLYWVWGGGLLATVLSLLPDNFYNTSQARTQTSAPDRYIGSLGWLLYYARFLLELSLLLKHTVKGPWLSDEEAKHSWTVRFKEQWQQRKFLLINDSVWATANLVCYFWWVGKGVKGQAGDLLTVGLLLMDLSVAIWRYLEEKAKHKEELEALVAEKRQLMRNSQQEQYQQKLNDIEASIKKCKLDWTYKEVSLINDIAYAASLLTAFAVMTVPFLPVTASLAFTCGLVGVIACFALTVIYSAISSGIDLAKTLNKQKDLSKQIKNFEDLFNSENDTKKLKLYYLQINDLKKNYSRQNKLIRYQSIHLARAVLIDAMLPVVMFAATVFMPMGVGLAIIGLTLAVALISKILIDKLAKPKKAVKTPFNSVDYDEFCSEKKTVRLSNSRNAMFGAHQNNSRSHNTPISPQTSHQALK